MTFYYTTMPTQVLTQATTPTAGTDTYRFLDFAIGADSFRSVSFAWGSNKITIEYPTGYTPFGDNVGIIASKQVKVLYSDVSLFPTGTDVYWCKACGSTTTRMRVFGCCFCVGVWDLNNKTNDSKTR